MAAITLEDISIKLDGIINDLATKATSDEIDKLKSIIAEKEDRICALESTLVDYKRNIDLRDKEIKNLQTRFDGMEKRFVTFEREVVFNRVITNLNSRLNENHEQVSRKMNLRIDGIEVTPNESPMTLIAHIKSECEKLNIGLQDLDFDHCHRNGSFFYKPDGTKHQCTLLRLCSWRARDAIYRNRKKFPFKVNHDLTKDRHELLAYARDLIENDETVSKVRMLCVG